VLFAITTTGKVVLLVVAGTFMAFALVTAIVIPRRRPEFPGNRLGAYLSLVGLLFLAQMGSVIWVAETQETEEGGAEAAETQPAGSGETEPSETGPGETETGPGETETEPAETETETEPAETETGATGTEPAESDGATAEDEGGGNSAEGEQVFASAGCGGCHTLAAAGSSGNVGPNLDEASPSFDKVVERVTNGQGAMPSFKDQLSEQQIRDVAAFVSESTRG
jgi:mono/diheme cytochrome c family protein